MWGVLFVLMGLLALTVLAMLFAVAMRRRPDPPPRNYELCASLLTPTEKAFYGTLMAAVSDTYFVAPKVRVADVLRPASSGDRRATRAALNRVSQKHFDFVLCDSRTFAFVSAIELDDASHDRARRRARDEFLDHAAETASLPLHRFKARRTYAVDEIRSALARELELEPHAAPHSGQTQSSGMSSQRVPAEKPAAGSPSASG